MKRIEALSAPLSRSCPGQHHTPPKHPVPMSLGLLASKLSPSLRSWPQLCHRCACPQPCLQDGLQTYAVACLQTCFLDGLWTHAAALSPALSLTLLFLHLLLLQPGLPGWILDLIHHLWTADGHCYQHLALPMLSRCWELFYYSYV